MSDDEAPKKRKILKKDKYDALIIVLDCGKNMEKEEKNGRSSFDCAKQAVDWILSRKIFTQAKDHINLVLLGGEETKNSLKAAHIVVREEYLAPVSFDHLKLLQNEIQLTENTGNVVDALLVAVDAMKQQTEGDAAIENKTILIVSNSESPLKGAEKLEHLKRAIQALDVDLCVMGIDGSSSSECAQTVSQFVQQVDGTTISFEEANSALHNFTQKNTAARAMKKNWEILPGIALPLAFHVRSTPAKNPLKAVAVDEKGTEIRRDVQYFVKNQPKDEFVDEELETDGKQVEKSDLVYGFLFGKSKIVLTDDDMAEYKGHNFNEGEKGGCLKLLQFTKRSNIPPSFFIGTNSYTVLPSYDKKNAIRDAKTMNLTLSLIESMLKGDTVAICRYAYHASAHLQLMALLPRRDEETGQLYMTAIRLPFMDDWRPFSLPDVSLRGPAPSSEQLSAIDDLIDAMDLSKSEADHKAVPNPFFQRQCTLMKMKAMKAMNCDGDVDLEPSVFLKRGLEPDPKLVDSENFKNITSSLAEIFGLEEIKRIKRTRKEYLAQNKDHLKGFDDADFDDEEDDDDLVKTEIIPIVPDPDGPQKKFWDKVRKALESGGTAINTWTNHVASDMGLFDDSNLAPVEKFKILRAEMLQTGRAADFNKWLMSLHGNDEYSDFFQFMDIRNEQSLITQSETAESWYTEAESEMYWSGLLDDEKKD